MLTGLDRIALEIKQERHNLSKQGYLNTNRDEVELGLSSTGFLVNGLGELICVSRGLERRPRSN